MMSSAATWTDLENMMFIESQRKTNTILSHLHMESKNNTNECLCKRHKGSQTQKTNLQLPEEEGLKGGKLGVWD